jgi:sigma-B regulation protein RsbU (phosphoserine phosphatase)
VQAIGGDFYNFVEVDAHRHGIFIGDAYGHGISAAMMMSMATTLVKHFAVGEPSPAEVVRKVNESFCETVSGSFSEGHSLFFSLFYAIVGPGPGTVIYANAGHPPALVVQPRGAVVHELQAHGTVVGVSAEERYGESRVQLGPGGKVVLYTDGLIEAFEPTGDAFGLERLKRIVRQNRRQDVEELVETIQAKFTTFIQAKPLRDDMTVLAIGF